MPCVQGQRSARAQRSLAASAMRRKDYAAAVRHPGPRARQCVSGMCAVCCLQLHAAQRLCSCAQHAFRIRCSAKCLFHRADSVLCVHTGLECLQAEHYQQALAISPLHADAWFALGYCRMKNDNPDTALQVFQMPRCVPNESLGCVEVTVRVNQRAHPPTDYRSASHVSEAAP